MNARHSSLSEKSRPSGANAREKSAAASAREKSAFLQTRRGMRQAAAPPFGTEPYTLSDHEKTENKVAANGSLAMGIIGAS